MARKIDMTCWPAWAGNRQVSSERRLDMIQIKRMDNLEIGRIAEIDRSEHVTRGYSIQDGKLVAQKVNWQIPAWFAEGPEHSVQAMVEFLSPALANGATLWGAFDGDPLVGVMVYRPRLTEDTAQLVFLHVNNSHRRRGIATRLTAECIRLARADGAEQLYVSATPSESAVGFYQNQGFRPVDKPHPELYELEPEDIHMIMKL
jgi:ribosomal protein S18 acetylase RimI-like enzyme